MRTKDQIIQLLYLTEQAVINMPERHKKKRRLLIAQIQIFKWVLSDDPATLPKKEEKEKETKG